MTAQCRVATMNIAILCLFAILRVSSLPHFITCPAPPDDNVVVTDNNASNMINREPMRRGAASVLLNYIRWRERRQRM